MPTLYQRLENFYVKDTFRFNEQGKGRIGTRLKALWRITHPDADTLPLVDSDEDTGQYKTVNYPDNFISIIDQLIRNVHREILDAAKERRLKESQVGPMPLHTIAKTPPPNKERKRIPVKAQPVWKSR